MTKQIAQTASFHNEQACNFCDFLESILRALLTRGEETHPSGKELTTMKRSRDLARIQRDWVRKLERWFELQGHGSKRHLAEKIGIDQSVISRLVNRPFKAPIYAVLAICHVTKLPYPKNIIPDQEERQLIATLRQLRATAPRSDVGAWLAGVEKAAQRLSAASKERLSALQEIFGDALPEKHREGIDKDDDSDKPTQH